MKKIGLVLPYGLTMWRSLLWIRRKYTSALFTKTCFNKRSARFWQKNIPAAEIRAGIFFYPKVCK